MSGSFATLKFCLPTHGDSILSKMNTLREDHRFCDVTLLLGGPHDTTAGPLHFHGHRVVLAASSDFLRDQFLLHEGRAELSVAVVSSMEVGKRLLLSCYTGLLEVPLRELVNYLTAASALQMSQVVEKCAQAVSEYLSPTLAFLKLERQSEKEILQPDCGCPCPSFTNQEERDVAQPSTSIQETSAKEGGAIVFQSKSRVGQKEKVVSQELRDIGEKRRVIKDEIESLENTTSCLNTHELEETRDIQAFHIKKSRCKLHPPKAVQDYVSSTATESFAQHEALDVVDSFQNPDERLSVGAQLQECGELKASNLFCLSRTDLSKSHCSEDELTEDSGGMLVQRPYLCRRCDRVFQDLENYVGHLKEHRQYLCLVCEKGFSQKIHLFRHIRAHTGVKPFRCPLCHKTFSDKASLQDHLNLHTGDKPHKCNYCAVHFAHKPGLRRHLKDTHGKSSLQNLLEEAADCQ